jgi:uncharacterized membrane protein
MKIWFVNANFVAIDLPKNKQDGINALYQRNECCPDFHLNGVIYAQDDSGREYTRTLVKLRTFKEFMHEVTKTYDVVEKANTKAALNDPGVVYDYQGSYRTFRILGDFIRQTDDAYLVHNAHGQFWVPKKVMRNARIALETGQLEGLIWTKFEPQYITEKK